jgi:hypothetical protein
MSHKQKKSEKNANTVLEESRLYNALQKELKRVAVLSAEISKSHAIIDKLTKMDPEQRNESTEEILGMTIPATPYG